MLFPRTVAVSIQGKLHIPCASLRHVGSHRHSGRRAWRRGAGNGRRPAVPTVPAAPARCLTKIGFLFSLVIFGRQSNLTLSCAFVTRCLSTLIVLVFANQINRMAFCRRRRFQSYYFLVFVIFLVIIAQRLKRVSKLHRRLSGWSVPFPLRDL